MGAPLAIEELVLECRKSLSTFRTAYPYGFLLVEPNQMSPASGFSTSHVTEAARDLALQLSRTQQSYAQKLQGILVLAIDKRADSPWRGRFSLGRTRNNDLVIADRSVSKLHAHLTWGEDDVMRITDANSTNGVRVNGVSLAPRDVVVVPDAAIVTVGDIPLRYVSTARFVEMLDGLL